MSNPTVISGNSLIETINDDDSDTIINGNSNTINLSGQSNSITLNGSVNTLNLSGDANNVTANGNGDILASAGNGNVIAANGLNDLVTLDGTGLALSIGDGGNVSLAQGSHATIGGGTETLNEVGGANLVFNGGPATLNVGGTSNLDVLNGNAEDINIAAASRANTVTVNGQSATLTIAGGGNTITANGTGDTLTITGSNNSIAVNGASGNIVSLSNYNNILDTAGTNVTFASSSGGTVDGGNDTIAIASSDVVTLNGSGFTTSLSGSYSKVQYDGAYGYLYISGAADSVTIDGNDDFVNQAGSNDTLILSGLAEQISVSGTGQILEVDNATVNVAAGASLTLAAGAGNAYSNGNIIDIAAAATVRVNGSGSSNNWLQASSGDTIVLTGLGDGIAASGTGNSISFASAGDIATVNGSSLSLGAAASLNLTGTNDSVKLGAGAGLTLTGAGLTLTGASDTITASGAGDIVTISGAGDVLSLNNGGVSFTGNGNVTATRGTGFAVNGIAFPADTLGAYNNPAATASLAALRATGANSVQLVVTQYAANTIASSLSTSSGTGLTTESDANLVAEIKQAKADGLAVFLAPHVNIDDGTWQALLKPSNIATFFANYQSFILHYAGIAQANGVATFSIGDELSSVDGSQYASYWAKLIAAVRQVYHGTLTYDSAWNNTGNVGFWSQLDQIGANAYVPVSDNIPNPSLTQLEQGWTSVNPLDSGVTGGVSAIQFYENLAAKYNKPILFTEAGYQSVNGTNTLTGVIPAPGATYVDYQQQALADQAMLTVLQQNDGSWFKGLYLWDWNPQATQVQSNDFSPQGKPSLAVIDAWYQGTEPATTGAQTGTLSGNSDKVGLGNAVTLGLSGNANAIVLGNGDTIKASGSAEIYAATANQLAGETIAGTGTDTLAVTTAGTLAANIFAHISGISAIDLAAGNDALIVSDALAASASGGTLSVVAGGTGTQVISAAALGATHAVHLTAGAGNATFTGGAGADILTAGKGADTLTGNGGADTYVYGVGDGVTTVINSTSLGTVAHGQITFISPLTDANLWFIKSGNNLQIDLLGSKSVLSVAAWFGTNKTAATAEITAGGLKLDSQLATLVTAMGSYQTANPGFNPQTATAMPANAALHAAIASAWHS
jgi:hypothetical protein